MAFTSASVLLFLLSFTLSYLVYLKNRTRSSLPLPPGPRKLPFIGNVLSIPAAFAWVKYSRWAKKHDSDILHLQLFSTSVIVLNSFKSANDLLGKRSSIYSHRPPSIMINELMGWSWPTSSLPYGKHWKDQRLLFHQHLHPSNATLHKPRESEHIHTLLSELLDAPDNFMSLIKYTVGGIMYSLAYGATVHPTNDPYVKLADKISTIMSEIMIPASSVVDLIPLLKYLPECMPGGDFKRKARQWRELTADFREAPIAAARDRVVDGTALPSYVSMCFEKFDGSSGNSYDLQLIKDTASIIFIAGTASTTATIYTFILAMMCFPKVQSRAQRELDQVVGRGRLPDFNDEPFLPYLSAILKETARWRPVAPIGLAHYLQQEDEYKGYRIPENSIIIANAWAMLHNEDDYPSPFSFNPDRFLKDGQLDPDVRDPASIAFGFGRRTCPGAHISLSTVWLAAASILSAFTISKPVDENGNVVEPSMEYKSGVTCQPLPFRCDIKPRYKDAVDIIRSSAGTN